MLHFINYFIRGLIIVIGILLLRGILYSSRWDDSFLKIMGIIFILFGIYRIILYRNQIKKYKFLDEEDDEEN